MVRNYRNRVENKSKFEAGQEIYIEKLDVEAGETVTFDKVLFRWWRKRESW